MLKYVAKLSRCKPRWHLTLEYVDGKGLVSYIVGASETSRSRRDIADTFVAARTGRAPERQQQPHLCRVMWQRTQKGKQYGMGKIYISWVA